jgi:hypothetical protein
VQSLSDRDQYTLAPSRLAVSEAVSVATREFLAQWKRFSGDDALRGDGPRFSVHVDGRTCTTRSAESTVPISISLSRLQSRTPSPQRKNYQVVLHAMQEKHTSPYDRKGHVARRAGGRATKSAVLSCGEGEACGEDRRP